MSISNFDDVSRYQHQKSPQLRDELAAEADRATKAGDAKAAKAATDQLANLDKDGLVTSAAVKEMAKETHQDPSTVDKLLAKYDPDGDGTLTHDEFDLMAHELPAGQGAGPAAPTAAGQGPQAPAAASAGPLDPTKPSPEETKAAVDGYGQAAQKALKDHPNKPLSDLLTTDPGLKAAGDKVFDTMNRLAANNDVTAANQAQQDLTAQLNVPAADRNKFDEAFANQRARRTAATADSKATVGMNYNANPVYDATFASNAGLTRDLKEEATGRTAWNNDPNNADGLKSKLTALDKAGYNDVRLEVNALDMPSPAIAQAYDLFKGPQGDYPYGSTVDAFANAVKNPPKDFKDAMAAAGVNQAKLGTDLKDALQLEDKDKPRGADLGAGRDMTNQEKLSRQLAYYDIQQEHMNTVTEIQKQDPNFKASLEVDLGPFHQSMGGGVPFDPAKMTPEQQAWSQSIVDRTQMIAQKAQKAGVGTVELHNEPNLESCHRKDPKVKLDDFFNEDPTKADDLTNVARQYAYLSGKAYDAIKKAPGGDKLVVDTGAVGFTSKIERPEVQLGKTTEELLAGATPEQRQAYQDAQAEYARYNGKPDPEGTHALGAQQKMWNILHQATGLEPPPHNNDAVKWLKTVQAAQQEFFGNTQIKTDETNIHLYATPQENEELIARLGEMRAAGQLPPSAKLGEYGSQVGNPDQKAADLYNQYSNTQMALQANGFKPTSMQAFGWDAFDGWGVFGPGQEDVPKLQRNRITGPA
ncbi:MAG: hypothetical protein JWM80_5010 [Cyanobacteria bacterium RYN_339]|nr:hypothetical protein [Cyanobacteria bacterium RYN_339]